MAEDATRREVPLAVPALGDAELEAVARPLSTGWVAQGPEVAAFESEFAALHGVPHAIACSSGTAALHLMLAASGIGPGDEVLVPSFTWVASVNAVLYTGATPVLVDVDPSTFNVDLDDLVARRTTRTRAVLAVHLFGLCADTEAIEQALPGVPVFEDAACAAGGSLRGRPAGSLGRAGAFSFHPRKTITTGEGGMVTTRDAALAEAVRRLRNHGGHMPDGVAPGPEAMPAFDALGYNYRLTDIQAAVGRAQLAKLAVLVAERQRFAERYWTALSDLSWLRLPTAADVHTYQSYVCLVDERAAGRSRLQIMEALAARGIATRPGTHAVHTLDFHARLLQARPEHLPGALECAQRSIAIPLHNRMVDADVEHVIASLRLVVAG